ncbi:FusB/FusC family EF-G-binding protein [Paenibacillus sp. L3-i20]|uniref:FusB/FusC family EF-G-binding protein n=1 Tax=Paenibacillus sp. L3-i20 TaxID=2905833 RepID=UPI001EE04998|nr:FusB/FusC family EF-G-binding protein [Paenibacillus sp. L3-i20]GKU76418.1 elongation factor G-binding protein [Paenibacillus sp. L3-i20]
MTKPFIRNHQYNLIKKLANQLQNTCNTVADRKVVEAVRHSVQTRILETFHDAMDVQKQMVEQVSTLTKAEEFQHYLNSLEQHVEMFKPVTEMQLKKLFPKVKKLKAPNLAAIDYRYVTYLGWNDIATNRKYIIYHLNDRLVGTEGRFTLVSKKSVCFLCNRHEEVALYTAVTKFKPANASPDYYKAIGNYVCVNSETCNKNITNVAALETFLHAVTGDRYL